MRLEDMLKDISCITNQVVKTNCFEGQNTLLESILLIQTKVNEVIQAINDGIIKGDKGDKGDTGETGAKGDKGDTGKASESIQDDVISLDTTWSSTKIDSCFNDLKNIQGVKYSNDVGYQVCKGTQNGVVKDLKIYGKSLVNSFSYDGLKLTQGVSLNGTKLKWELSNQSWVNVSKNIGTIKPNTLYTVICDIGNNTLNNEFILMDSSIASRIPTKNIIIPLGLKNSRFITSFTSKDNVDAKGFICQCQSASTGIIEIDKIMILEGDHTQNPPQYFEGIASVGNGNEIEVLSRKEDGNLFNPYQGVAFDKSNWVYDGEQFNINSNQNYLSNWYYVQLEPNTKYYIKADLDAWVRVYKGKTISHGDGTHQLCSIDSVRRSNTFTSDSTGWITARLTCETKQGISYIKNLIISKFDIPYVEYKQDKKTVLYKDTDNTWKPVTELRGIDFSTCDTIENDTLSTNVGLKSLIGSENFVISTSRPETTLFILDSNEFKKNGKCLCDKLRVYSITELIKNDVEGISIHDTMQRVVLSLSKTKATTVEQLKAYLTTNNINFLYEKNISSTYEINPIYPNSFYNETMVLFNTGVIPCKNEFYIDSNLGSLQLETLDRLSRIEDTIYKSNVALLRGDFRALAEMYFPNDFIKEEELTNE